MDSKAKLLGHPVHPMLIVFPLGLLVSAVAFNVIYYVTGRSGLAVVSFWNIAAGVLMGLGAAIFGLVDWIALPQGTRAKRVGLLHGVGSSVVLLLFAAAWLARKDDLLYSPTAAAFVLEVLGVTLAALTGWLGGELVHRLAVGVDYGANLNAPSSLSGEPALPFQAKLAGHAKGGRSGGNGRRLVHGGRS